MRLVAVSYTHLDVYKRQEALYTRFIGERRPYRDVVYQSKKLIMRASMSSELNVLGHQLNRLSERDRHYRDFTLNSLTHAVREIIACFPVYRSYLTTDREAPLDRDQAYIVLAVARAKRRNPTPVSYTHLPLYCATSSPIRNTRESRRISSVMALRRASRN